MASSTVWGHNVLSHTGGTHRLQEGGEALPVCRCLLCSASSGERVAVQTASFRCASGRGVGGSFLASTIFFIREIHPLLSRIVNVSLYHLSNLQILTPLLLLLILPMCDAMRRLVGFVFSDDTAASGCLPCGEGLVHLLHEERLRTFSFFTLPHGDSPSTARLGPSRRTSYAGRSSTLLLGLDLLAGTPMIARTGLWSDPMQSNIATRRVLSFGGKKCVLETRIKSTTERE